MFFFDYFIKKETVVNTDKEKSQNNDNPKN